MNIYALLFFFLSQRRPLSLFSLSQAFFLSLAEISFLFLSLDLPSMKTGKKLFYVIRFVKLLIMGKKREDVINIIQILEN